MPAWLDPKVRIEELIESLKDEINTFRQTSPSLQADARHLQEYRAQVFDMLFICNGVIAQLQIKYPDSEHLRRVKRLKGDLQGILDDGDRRQREADLENSMRSFGPQERPSTPHPEVEAPVEETATPKQEDYSGM